MSIASTIRISIANSAQTIAESSVRTTIPSSAGSAIASAIQTIIESSVRTITGNSVRTITGSSVRTITGSSVRTTTGSSVRTTTERSLRIITGSSVRITGSSVRTTTESSLRIITESYVRTITALLLSAAFLHSTSSALAQPDSASATPTEEALPANTTVQDLVNNNPIKLSISKDEPSFDLPTVSGTFGVDESVKLALKNNLALKQSEQDTLITRFMRRAALGRFGPQVSFNTFYSTSSLNQMLFLPNDSPVASAPMQPIVRGTSFSAMFAATQPLLTGGRLLGGYKAAQAIERQSVSALQGNNNTTAWETRDAYWQAAWTEAKLRVDSDYVKLKEWSAKNIKERVDEGKTPRADYLREMAELARAKRQANDDFRDYNIALVRLKTKIGINYSSLFFLKDSLEFKEMPGGMSDYLLAAGKNRPEISQATQKLAEAKARRMIARSKYAPQLNAYGLGSNISGSSPDGNSHGSWGGVIGVVGGVTLFDSGIRTNELRAADNAVKQNEIALAEIKQKVAEDVSVAWIELEFAKKNVDDARAEVASAEEDQRLLHARYLAGKAIALEDFDAGVKLLQARLSLIEAIYKHRLAQVKLLWASASIV